MSPANATVSSGDGRIGGADDEGAFRPARLLWVAGVGIAAALAFVVVGTFAPDLQAGRDAQAHALSRSSVGFAGLVRLLGDTGVPVSIGHGETGHGEAAQGDSTGAGAVRPGLLILTPPAEADPEAVRRLTHSGGAVLLVAPKWLLVPSPKHEGWAIVEGLLGPKRAAAALARPEITALATDPGALAPVLGPGDPAFVKDRPPPLAFGPVENLQYLPSDTGLPLLVDRSGRRVLVSLADGPVFVLTDPDLLNNHGLANATTAASALALIDRLRRGGPVRFDVTLDGLGTPRNLVRIALTPPFLAATLCALAALALAGWRSLVRFGPALRPRRAVALGKLALVETSAGLIRMAGRERAMSARYVAVVRAEAARAVGAPPGSTAASLDAWLDRLGESSGAGAPFTELAAAAERPRASPAEALARAQALHAWKTEVMRGRR